MSKRITLSDLEIHGIVALIEQEFEISSSFEAKVLRYVGKRVFSGLLEKLNKQDNQRDGN